MVGALFAEDICRASPYELWHSPQSRHDHTFTYPSFVSLGDEHPDTLTSMNNLAATNAALGRAKDAGTLHEKVLELRTRALGDEHQIRVGLIDNAISIAKGCGHPRIDTGCVCCK